MDEHSNPHGRYVGRIHEDTHRMVRDLIDENARLHILAAEDEREIANLRERLTTVTAELARREREASALRIQMSALGHDTEQYVTRFAELEQRTANLASLYVSGYQLHGTLHRPAVLEAIREIVINLVGSEEFAVFERHDEDGGFELATSFGIDEERFRRLPPSHPLVQLAASGELHLAGAGTTGGGTQSLVACVPTRLDGRVVGAIVLFSLVSHKPELQELDVELFELLGTQAGCALYCSRLAESLMGGAPCR